VHDAVLAAVTWRILYECVTTRYRGTCCDPIPQGTPHHYYPLCPPCCAQAHLLRFSGDSRKYLLLNKISNRCQPPLLSRILFGTTSNLAYLTLRPRLLPGNIATRPSPWHISSSYCSSTCSYRTRRYTMRYSTLLLLFSTMLDRRLCLPVVDNRNGPHGSVLAPDGVAYCSLPYIYRS
jgi:hypothetical protein